MRTHSLRIQGTSLLFALLALSGVLICVVAPVPQDAGSAHAAPSPATAGSGQALEGGAPFIAGHTPPGQQSAEESKSLPKLTFAKTLKGSVPEFCQITVDANGDGSYEGRKLDESPNPRPLKLSPATARRLFDLAAGLRYFRNIDLESHRRVANLGSKTLTYQQGSQLNRTEFNYTQNRTAQELADLFEKVAAVEQHIVSLEFATKYDPLRLPQELLLIQIDLDNKALVGTELMVPTLEAIAKNPRFLHLAQTRAQDILQRIQVSN